MIICFFFMFWFVFLCGEKKYCFFAGSIFSTVYHRSKYYRFFRYCCAASAIQLSLSHILFVNNFFSFVHLFLYLNFLPLDSCINFVFFFFRFLFRLLSQLGRRSRSISVQFHCVILCNIFGRCATVPMMNHHTIPKYGFGKTSTRSFYLPKICTKGNNTSGSGKCGSGNAQNSTVSLELSHGNNKQLITLPAEKLDNNKRYYVTFTLKDTEQSSNTQTTLSTNANTNNLNNNQQQTQAIGDAIDDKKSYE